MAVVTNNRLITPQVIGKLALFDLRTRNTIVRNMSTEVTPEFTNKAQKVGAEVQIRRPYRFIVTPGLGYQPQPIADTVMPVKVDRPLQISYQADSIEATLYLREAMNIYARPASIAMASTINSQGAQFAAQNTPNYAGVPGTTPSDVATFLTPNDTIRELGLPEDEDLHLVVNRRISSAYVAARSVYFSPVNEQNQSITRGHMVDATMGYIVDRDQSIYIQQIGTFAGTPVVAAGSALQADGGNNGTMTLTISGFTGASGSNSLNLGDKFTINNVYSVHPQTRQSTGRLQGFTVLGNVVDNNGTMTPVVFPAITPVNVNVPPAAGNQYANVTAAAVVGANVNIWAGTSGSPTLSSGKASVQGLVMHEDAFAFVSVPLASPPSGKGDTIIVTQDRDPETGMWLSFIHAWDSKDRIYINRWDSLVGFGRLYAAECAAVLAG